MGCTIVRYETRTGFNIYIHSKANGKDGPKFQTEFSSVELFLYKNKAKLVERSRPANIYLKKKILNLIWIDGFVWSNIYCLACIGSW